MIQKGDKVGIVCCSNGQKQIYKEKIEYFGALSTDLNNLKISNQGGTIIIRVVNQTGIKVT